MKPRLGLGLCVAVAAAAGRRLVAIRLRRRRRLGSPRAGGSVGRCCCFSLHFAVANKKKTKKKKKPDLATLSHCRKEQKDTAAAERLLYSSRDLKKSWSWSEQSLGPGQAGGRCDASIGRLDAGVVSCPELKVAQSSHCQPKNGRRPVEAGQQNGTEDSPEPGLARNIFVSVSVVDKAEAKANAQKAKGPPKEGEPAQITQCPQCEHPSLTHRRPPKIGRLAAGWQPLPVGGEAGWAAGKADVQVGWAAGQNEKKGGFPAEVAEMSGRCMLNKKRILAPPRRAGRHCESPYCVDCRS